MKRDWKVGELARMTGVTVRTLRFYDQIGLLVPSGQTESGHRLYGEQDLARLHQIVSLKELGLSLEEIKSAFAGGQIRPLEIVRLQADRIKAQMRVQQQLLDKLAYVSKRMREQEPLAAEDFADLLLAMNAEFEKPSLDRQRQWEGHLDRLGALIADHAAKRDAHTKEE
ncbi:MerR family transcriptional regulator [Cohnella sp. 56]|uniref:MerR family transcriptional regulator n=1 Tax=Cohnella sp. 56 TaxID=3113722 RepID=UPI0030E9239A